MKVIYTESAKQELEAFQQRQVSQLEQIIRERKYVFGDEVLEVTASDIREAAEYIRPISRGYRRRLMTVSLVTQVYMFFGIILTLGGVAYPYLRDLNKQSLTQFTLIIAGVTITLASFFMALFYKLRAQRLEEYERDVKKRESLS
jgi:hypothetical protein